MVWPEQKKKLVAVASPFCPRARYLSTSFIKTTLRRKYKHGVINITICNIKIQTEKIQINKTKSSPFFRFDYHSVHVLLAPNCEL